MDNKLIVGIADMKLAQNSGLLVTYALGSCIGICLYDPILHIGSLTHIMLPLNMEAGRKNAFKYADTGIREVLNQMSVKGCARPRMIAKIAGGARMFELSGGALGNIGQRNIESVRIALKREGIRLVGEDVGGTVARTLVFDVSNGDAFIRSYGIPEKKF
jgi:chemotaxis protein CheD